MYIDDIEKELSVVSVLDSLKSTVDLPPKSYTCYACENRVCESCDNNHGFYSSSVTQCPRKVAFQWLYGPKEIEDPEAKKRMYYGTLIHSIVSNILLSRGIASAAEVKRYFPLGEGFFLSAKVDIISHDRLVEIKTTKLRNIRYMKKPRDNYVHQLNLYLHFFEYDIGEIIVIPADSFEVSVLMADGDSVEESILESIGDWKSFVIEYDRDMALSDIEFFLNIARTIKDGKMPLRKIGKNCDYCEWREECLS